MTNKLYVARLPFIFSHDQLRALFEAIGPVVSAEMVLDVKNNRTRGFGFVTMESVGDAQRALNELNGKRIEDRAIWITEAREKQSKPESPDSPDDSSFNRDPSARPHRDPRGPRPSNRPRRENSFFSPDGPFGKSSDGLDPKERRPFQRGPERRYPDSRPPRPFGDKPRFPGSRPDSRPNSGFGDQRRPPRFGDERPRRDGPREGFRGPRREGPGFGPGPRGPRREGGFGGGPRREGPGGPPRLGFRDGPGRFDKGPGFGPGPRGDRAPRREGPGASQGPRVDGPKGPRRDGPSGPRRPFSSGPGKSGPRKPFSGPRKPFSGPRKPRY